MERLRILIVIFLGMLMCGCGSNNSEPSPPVKGLQDIADERVHIDAEYKTPDISNETLAEETEQKAEKIPVNTAEEIISTEWDGVRIQSRVFAAVDNKLYFCQWAREGREAALYEMEIGGSILQKIDMDIPESMDIYALASDKADYLYLLLRSNLSDSENVTSIIRKLDEKGNIVQELDISDAIQDKISIVQGFLIDGEGDFYIRGMSTAVGISREGVKLWEVKDDANPYGLACGADGAVYMTYQKDGNNYIGKVNSEDGTIIEEYYLAEIESNDQILALGQGTDSDLLLYGNMSGCWAWNKEGNVLENRASLSEAELSYSETITIRAFLEDGRLLLVKNISEGDELVARTYKYIPTRN